MHLGEVLFKGDRKMWAIFSVARCTFARSPL